MKKKKLILFDWGNIVEDGNSLKKSWNEVFKKLGYLEKEDIIPKIRKYELSGISSMEELEKTYYEMKEEFNLNKEFKDFLEIYEKEFYTNNYYKEVRDYEHSLKDKCYIGILSNLLIIDKNRLDRQVDLSNYDYVFLSFEFGLRKPNPKFYEEIMNKIDFNKKDILFIDDSIINIESASNFGWNTLCTTGKELDLIKDTINKFLK